MNPIRIDVISGALATFAAATGLAGHHLPGGEIDRTNLPNGLDLILARKSGVPLVTLEIAIRAGAFIETPELNGLTHLHEHMFFKANRTIPDQAAYLRRLDELGASWNGSTAHEVVRYHLTIPASFLREGLEFLRDAIGSPLFLPEELEKERKVVLGEYDRNEANPTFHLHRALERAMFGAHYSRKNVIGEREVIAAATREKLGFIQDQFYVPNNAALIIAGELAPSQVERLAAEVFGSWPRRPDPFARNPVPRHPPMEMDSFQVVEREVGTGTVLLGWHGPSAGEALEDAVAADVIAQALNHPRSRFRAALVDSGLASQTVFSYSTLNHVGPMTLRIETEPEKALRALAAARSEIDFIGEPGYLTAGELSRAAEELATEEAFRKEKSRDFALALGFWWSLGAIDAYLGFPERMRRVGPADVSRVARRYLPRGGAKTAVCLLVSKAARESLGIGPETMAEAANAVKGGKAPAGEAPPGILRSLDLGNGSRVLVKTNPGSEVAFFGIYFRGHPERSSAEEAGLEGLLLGTLEEALERALPDDLARLGARVFSRVDPDYSRIGIRCIRGNLDEAARLLAEGLRRLELRPEDVDRNRARGIARYKKLMEDPDHAVGFVANRTFLPKGHPYLGYPEGTAESLKALRLEDLSRRRSLLLTGSRILAVVVGDMGPDRARALAEKMLGDLPRGEAPDFRLDALSGPPGCIAVEEREIPTCYILGRFRAPAPGEPDFEALSLALSILQRKMFLEVRTRRALTYAVLSGISDRARNSAYLSVTTTRPEEALRAMYGALDSLIENPLPEDEFRASSMTFLTRLHLRRETAAEQAEEIAQEELVAGDHRRALAAPARFGKVTPADIQRVLGTYLQGIHFGLIGPRRITDQLDRSIFSRR